MFPIKIGKDLDTGEPVFLDPETLSTHTHVIGATGAGKTETLKPILMQRWLSNDPPACSFVLDAFGGLSNDLLNWFAHPTLCTDDLRDRLVYIEPAKTDLILPFNPLRFTNDDDLFFNTGRTVEVMLRGSESQNLASQPRLRQWMFNSFLSTAAMGYPPAVAEFLLRPGTEQHTQLMRQIPERLRSVWAEVLNSGGNMKMQLLESTRNRTAPFFDCRVLQMMLSQSESRFDVEQLIRDRKIVIINLAQDGVIDAQIAATLGGLFLNEIIQQARNLPTAIVKPTLLCLDEFQNWVSADLMAAIPEVRQRGIELILAHQSISQLKRGDIDLTSIIWQCRNRIMFCNNSEDADLIALELASLTFDPMKLKEELKSFRQRKTGQHIQWLKSIGHTDTHSTATDETFSASSGESHSTSEPKSGGDGSTQRGDSSGEVRGKSNKDARSTGTSESMTQTLVDDWEDFYETSSKTYFTFAEQFQEWAKLVRKMKTGEMVCKFKDDSKLYRVKGEMIEIIESPELLERKAELLEKNFKQDYFITRQQAESDWKELVENLRLGRVPAIIEGESKRLDCDNDDDSAPHLFR